MYICCRSLGRWVWCSLLVGATDGASDWMAVKQTRAATSRWALHGPLRLNETPRIQRDLAADELAIPVVQWMAGQ
jgi:hypothetical protein